MISGLMRLDLEGVEISAGGRRDRCETDIASVGGYVIVVTTVIERHHVQLTSSYLSDLAGHTAVAHMWTATRPYRFEHRTVHLSGSHHGRVCLLDHAAELRQLLAEDLGLVDVCVDVGEGALRAAERVWDETPG